MTTTEAKPWPTTVPLCGKPTTYREHNDRAQTVSCALPIGHDGPHEALLNDGTHYLFGPDHEGVAP